MSSCDVLFRQQELARSGQLQSVILVVMADDHHLPAAQDVATGYGSRESRRWLRRDRLPAIIQIVGHRMPANMVV
jgi:hypothetical protein